MRLVLLALAVIGSWAAAAEPVDYIRQVKPVLKQRCYPCHGVLKQKAGLRLDTGASILQGAESGLVVERGHDGLSPLIDRVTEIDPAVRMPPEGSPLTTQQIELLRGWIDQGAGSPDGELAETDPRQHWAFLKPARAVVPEVRDRAWVRNPIDSFLARAREHKRLAPLLPAEPHVLLRRLYLDLTGLPPTRDELREFLTDPSEAAYERVVDRLLASPRYGERWARHWMDVWRYSDWYGRRAVPDVLNSYAQIWRWRDWIVSSLNHDKGYDRMVQEMLAADELAPTDQASLVATGFLVRNFYRWNYNTWMKDNVEHTGKAFLGLTFNCAHCHDHKYDPIKHDDYFAFRAFFEPLELRHDRVPGEPDPGPYPKYVYGKAYGPIKSGMVRVFDEKLDAQTFLYTRGESRNVVAGRPPIAPGMPTFLGGGSLRVEPIDLPAEASYPGSKAFVQREERARRVAALVDAERLLADSHGDTRQAEIGKVRLVAARSELVAIDLRIAADEARCGSVAGDVKALSRAAARAERQAAVDHAVVEVARAERAVSEAGKQAATETAKANERLVQARKRLETAQVALGQETTEYTRLSPIYPTRSTGRRAALARWITSRENPLAARVAINHLWRWHFGTPLVATTADFGRNGKPPTHPELLDWLAVELMEPSTSAAGPWSMKAIHRLIVTSAAYRMSSHPSKSASHREAIDRDNLCYWRFPSSRLEAEDVRDSLLHAAGALDLQMGGPDIDFSQGLVSSRRSLYFTHHGEARMPFLELFDAPDACDCYRRTNSVVPQQALALVNNELLAGLSRRLADRLWSDLRAAQSQREQEFVRAAFEQVLSRPPSAEEHAVTLSFLSRQLRVLQAANHAQTAGNSDEPAARARGDLVHALFSHNDFITIH